MNANSDKEYIDHEVGNVRVAIDDFRTSVNERFDGLRASMDARFDALNARIDAAVAKGVSEVIKWVVGLFITMIVLTVGLASVVMHLVLNQPKAATPAPAPPLSAPALIIQLSPQGAAVLPAVPPSAGKP